MDTTIKCFYSKRALYLLGCGLLAAAPALAADVAGATKVTFRTDAASASSFRPTVSVEYVLSAAPREDEKEAQAIFGPVAEYLSTVLNKKVVYKHPGNWGIYQGMMQKDAYDLVFDGAHFNSWRVDHTQHNVLVKVPGDHAFVVLVKKDNDKINQMKQLAGRTLCAFTPPNLGTLTALKEFDNPARQPVIVNTEGWKDIYQGMLTGKCVAAVVPIRMLEKFEKNGAHQAKIIFRGATLPDSAISAGPRLTASEQEKIARALLSPEGEKATARMREKYSNGRAFALSNNREYSGLSAYLRNEWGY